jgi:hypothetical protein
MSAMPAHVKNQSPKAAKTSQVRQHVAEKVAVKAKKGDEKTCGTAEAAADRTKYAYATTIEGAQRFGTKVLEFAHANTGAALAYATQVSGVKSPSEFFKLSNGHLRQQFEIFSRQAVELTAIAQKATVETTESIKASAKTAS